MILRIENIEAAKKIWNDIETYNATNSWPQPLGTKIISTEYEPDWVKELRQSWANLMMPDSFFDRALIVETAYRGIIEYFLERHQ